jgi:outer membrane protein assembly factor BamB
MVQMSGDTAEDVYVACENGSIVAFNPRNGTQMWEYKAGSHMMGEPTVDGQTIYAPASDGHVTAIDPTGPREKWSCTTYSPILTTPTVAHGQVYCGTKDHRAFAINKNSGRREWSIETNGRIISRPVTTPESVIFTNLVGEVYCLNPDSGIQRWKTKGGPSISVQPTIHNNSVIVTTKRRVYSYDLNTGSENWNHPIGGRCQSSPAYYNGSLYVGTGNCLKTILLPESDPHRATPRSSSKNFIGDNIIHIDENSPEIDRQNGTLYLGMPYGRVAALDANSDAHLWTRELQSDLSDKHIPYITLLDGKLYIATRNKMFALDSQTGNPIWSPQTGTTWSNTLSSQIEGSPSIFSHTKNI